MSSLQREVLLFYLKCEFVDFCCFEKDAGRSEIFNLVIVILSGIMKFSLLVKSSLKVAFSACRFRLVVLRSVLAGWCKFTSVAWKKNEFFKY